MPSPYPSGFSNLDTDHSAPGDAGTLIRPEFDLSMDAINKLEATLGLNPHGTVTDVAARLTAIESRIATLEGGGNPPGQAAFPSRLRASGVNIVDENDFVMPTLRGFNMHVVPWAQSDLDAIAALDTRAIPGRMARFIIRWQSIQPTNGTSVSSSFITSLDTQITRCVNAGIYVMFELHLNVGDAIPTWVGAGNDDTDKFYLYGEYVTRYLANRYGNPASAQYTKAVMGFGLNEPPIYGTAANSNTSIPYLETRQATIFNWMRTAGTVSGTSFQGAPDWIAFAALGYAQQTPLYDGPGENTSATKANPNAYTNWVFDLHDYFARDRGSSNATPSLNYVENPLAGGRQYNGQPYSYSNGGPMTSPGNDGRYLSTYRHRQQLAAFIKPYKTFCQTYGIPLMIGEWGWTPNSGQTAEQNPYIDDHVAAWSDAGAAIELHWDYDVTTDTVLNPWAARPGGGSNWLPSITRWLSNTTGNRQFVFDKMAGTAGEQLAVRNGEIGADWTTLLDRTGWTISSAGRAYSQRPGGAADDAISYASGAPGTADYDVSADFHVLSATAEAGIAARVDTTAKTGYKLNYNAATGVWSIQKFVAGTLTTLGTYTLTIPNGSNRSGALRVRGTAIAAYIDGTERITATDSAITSAGRVAVWSYGISTDTTGIHLDNVSAVNLV